MYEELDTFGKRLQWAMDHSNPKIDKAGLARRLDITYQAVRKVMNGTGSFGAENTFKAAHYLGTDPHWLATGNGLPTVRPSQQVIRKPVTLLNVGSIPLLNQGNTKLLDSYMDGTADHQPPNITYHSDDTTGLIAYTVPDDLNEPRIPNGCTAIINMNAEPVHGKLSLIQDGERSYIRRLVIDGDLRYQETVSGRLPPRPLTGHIIGVVKEVIISMD